MYTIFTSWQHCVRLDSSHASKK